MFLLISTNELLNARDDCHGCGKENARGNFSHWHAGSLSMTAMRQRLIFSSSTMVNSVATLAVRYRVSWLVVTKKHPITQDKRKIKESLNQSVLPFLSQPHLQGILALKSEQRVSDYMYFDGVKTYR